MYRDLKFIIMHRTGEKTYENVPALKIEWLNANNTPFPELVATDKEGVSYKIDWENNFLLECTGMFDKDGLLAYHGDILENEEGKRYEVFFAWGGFFITESEEGDRVFLSDLLMRKMKVVGNVFQTPELIVKPVNEEEFNKKINEQQNESNQNQ